MKLLVKTLVTMYGILSGRCCSLHFLHVFCHVYLSCWHVKHVKFVSLSLRGGGQASSGLNTLRPVLKLVACVVHASFVPTLVWSCCTVLVSLSCVRVIHI